MSIASQYVTGRKEIIRITPYVYKDANIWGIGNVCSSVPFEKLTVSLTSAYSVSVLVAELVASPGIVGILLLKVSNPVVVASPASAYSLSTAVT